MSKNIFALDKNIGVRANGNKGAYLSDSEFLTQELPDKVYWKPIVEDYYNVGEPIFTTKAGIEAANLGASFCLIEYDKCYTGELYAVANNKIYKVNVECESVFIDLVAPTNVTYYHRADIPVPDGTEIKFYETEPIKQYNFENLAFTTDSTDTLLENLYTYIDKWGNKRYSLYQDYTLCPDFPIDENGNIIEGSSVDEVPTNDPIWTAIKLEAAQHLSWTGKNDALRRSYTEGINALNIGQQNIVFSDNTSAFGEKNLSLQKGACTIGSRNFVRSIDGAAIGLNNIVTGRYAVALNEGGHALGYGSLAFGDHCKALDYYDVAGGFQSVAKGNTSIAFGRYVTASGFGAVALGELTVADGRFCIVGGNKNECYGGYSLVAGVKNIVKGFHSIVCGERNTVNGAASIVGGIGNTNTGDWGLLTGTKNNLGGNNSAVIGTGNTNNGRNGSLVAGQGNTNEGERSSIVGGINNYIAAAASDSLAFGSHIKIAKADNVAIGTTIESENTQCWSIGRRLKTAGDRQMILGIGNEEDPNAMLIIGAGHNNDTDPNAKRINALTVRQYTGNVEIPRPVLISPSGNKFLLKVSDDGTLSTGRM